MIPKPRHFGRYYAETFKDAGIVAAYHLRPPHHPQLFAFLADLIPEGEPRRVLDVGCGTGDIARGLAPLVAHVDAVDFSEEMIAKGKRSAGGDHPHLYWILGVVETAALSPPYGLVTAGDSLHWMDWEIVFPRLTDSLAPGGVLALIERSWRAPPEADERIRPLFPRYSINQDYQPYDLTEELVRRSLFRPQGEQQFAPYPWRPTIAEYIESRHSQQGFSRERMGEAQAEAFDRELRAVLEALCEDGVITVREERLLLSTLTRVVWGRPLNLSSP